MPGFSLPERMHLTSLEVHHPDRGDPVLLIKRNLGSEIVREGGIRHFDDEENVAGLRQSPSLLDLASGQLRIATECFDRTEARSLVRRRRDQARV
jgi:hypothetical protein